MGREALWTSRGIELLACSLGAHPTLPSVYSDASSFIFARKFPQKRENDRLMLLEGKVITAFYGGREQRGEKDIIYLFRFLNFLWAVPYIIVSSSSWTREGSKRHRTSSRVTCRALSSDGSLFPRHKSPVLTTIRTEREATKCNQHVEADAVLQK